MPVGGAGGAGASGAAGAASAAACGGASVLRAAAACGDVRRALLGLRAPAPAARPAAAPSATGASAALAIVSRCPATAAASRSAPARASVRARSRRARWAARSRAQPREPPRPLLRLGAEPLVLRRRAREALDPRHRLVERGRAEDHGDRVGLALDVEVAEERRDALLGGGEGAAHDLRPPAAPCSARASSRRARLEARQLGLRAGQGRLGRVQLQERRGLRRRASACFERGRLGAALEGVEPVIRAPAARAAPSSGHLRVSGLTRRRP